MVSFVFLSLLASRELVYPFSWQQQGLATELNGSILKRWVWEDFQMSGCLARWKVFMAQTHSQALWHTFSVTVAHWTYPTTPEKRVWGCLGCSMGRVAVPHPEKALGGKNTLSSFPSSRSSGAGQKLRSGCTQREQGLDERGFCPSLWEVISCLLEQAWILSSNLVPFTRLLHALQFA